MASCFSEVSPVLMGCLRLCLCSCGMVAVTSTVDLVCTKRRFTEAGCVVVAIERGSYIC